MKVRILTSIVGLAVLAVVLCLFDTPVFECAVALICLIAIHETYKAFDLGRRGPWIFGGFAVYTLLLIGSAAFQKLLLAPFSFLFVVYLAVCVVGFNRELDVKSLGGMAAFGVVIWSAFYSFVFIKTCLPSQQYGHEAVFLVLMTLAFAWGGDSCAYFTGRFLGKHKLAPLVSPNKTVEGAIGGIIGSGVVGVLVTLAARSISGFDAGGIFGYLTVFFLGMGCSVLGILGDLFASAVKRQLDIKDYGTIFPGHGGIMDRFDSVLFIAPLVALVVWLRTM